MFLKYLVLLLSHFLVVTEVCFGFYTGIYIRRAIYIYYCIITSYLLSSSLPLSYQHYNNINNKNPIIIIEIKGFH